MTAPIIATAFVAQANAPVHSTASMTWQEITVMLGTVTAGPKDGPAWMPVQIEPGPRNGERVKAVTALGLDIEAKTKKDQDTDIKMIIGPDPPEVDVMVTELELAGWSCALHTTYSHHDPEILPAAQLHPRYRLVFELSRPLLKTEVKPLGLHVATLLGISASLDEACLEPARIYYSPSCPEERLDDFRHAAITGDPLDVDALLNDAKREAAALARAIKKTIEPTYGKRTGKRTNDVIDRFNQFYAIGDILEQHGYIPKRGNRWLYPASTTGVAGVRLLPKADRPRIYSSHGNDPLNDNHAHDAFDVYRILEHGGNVRAAVRSAADLLGLNGKHKAGVKGLGGATATASGLAIREHDPGQESGSDSVDERLNGYADAGEERIKIRTVNIEDDAGTKEAPPEFTDDMLYGLVGAVAKAAAGTEPHPVAVAANFLGFLSAMAGRDVYLPIGNTKHHARLFFLHVGCSGRGRKGDAVALIERIIASIQDQRTDNEKLFNSGPLGRIHTGGLSSREGLAWLIHDGYQQGKEDIPPIYDKRLHVVESEFANILHQGKREGNTLSPALRDAWDGKTIAPAIKTNRTWSTNPHIAINGAITPEELLAVIEQRELTNGFAGRFLIFWAERLHLISNPQPAPQDTIDALARSTRAVIEFARGEYPKTSNSRAGSLTPAAEAMFHDLYHNELNALQGSALFNALLERQAAMLKRFAMLFAFTDHKLVIDEQHLNAALGWVRYGRQSVKYVFSRAWEDKQQVNEDIIKLGQRILVFIAKQPERQADKTEIYRDCFKSHVSASKIDAALAYLLNATPPKLEQMEKPRADGQIGAPRMVYVFPKCTSA